MTEKPSISRAIEKLAGDPVSPKGWGWQKIRCPLPDHEDRNPSATMSEEAGSWHCFSCDKGGSAYDLIMEIEGCGFPEAVEVAEERLGECGRNVRGGTSGKPGYLTPGGKGDSGRRRPYRPAWLRGRAGGGT